MQAQGSVHFAREEGKRGREDGADDRRAGEHGGGEDGVAVDEIVVDALEDDAEGEAEGGAGGDGDEVVDLGGVGPGELWSHEMSVSLRVEFGWDAYPEEADGRCDCAGHAER